MVTKKHIIIGALAVAGVLFVVHRANAATPKCGKGTKLVRMTLGEARAKYGAFQSWPQIEEQVRRFGGVCLAQGTATDAGTRPIDDDSDIQDQVLITHPWQLL